MDATHFTPRHGEVFCKETFIKLQFLPKQKGYMKGHACKPDGGELREVVMAIDEADEDFQDEQADVRVLQQREGQERVQEGAGQSRQHVGALEAARHLHGRGT